MITDAEVKEVVDRLFECEEGRAVTFGEMTLISQDWLRRWLRYEEVKKVFDAYYKRVDKEEEKHAKEVFEDLKRDVRERQDDDLRKQLGL